MGLIAQKYEIVTPVDPYSITSTSEAHAAAAVIVLSGAAEIPLALRSRFGSDVCPTFHLSGEAGVEEWWRGRRESRGGSLPFFDWIVGQEAGVADALESVQLEVSALTQPVDLRPVAQQLAREFRRKERSS